jgi:RNA polymerase sigma factor (sigma-70 family)
MQILSDRDLLLALKKANRTAFNEIYERYWLKLYNSVYKRVNDHDVTFDIVQDVFCSLWIRREVLEVENLSGYLFQAVKFQTLKFFRRSDLERVVTAEIAGSESSSSSDMRLLDKEAEQRFDVLVRSLSAKQQEIFRMRFEESKTPQQIAELQNVSTKTVQNSLSLITLEIRRKFILLCLIGSEAFRFLF